MPDTPVEHRRSRRVGIEELLARMHATLRRSRPGPLDDQAATVTVGDVVVDLGAQLVTKGGA